ncbi:MAG: hypothetical protein B9S34_05585 [Opitutia bacterium Tous-C1TDCM]|nr:MAG: hypothetical protein B9S34_05585 [Opitutae bacterium Tous-C1TDCM]
MRPIAAGAATTRRPAPPSDPATPRIRRNSRWPRPSAHARTAAAPPAPRGEAPARPGGPRPRGKVSCRSVASRPPPPYNSVMPGKGSGNSGVRYWPHRFSNHEPKPLPSL